MVILEMDFERILGVPFFHSSFHSIMLWLVYILFSVLSGSLYLFIFIFFAYRYKAKEVFIKGLQDIPSAKVLGLDLIHYLDQNPQRHTSETIQAEVQDIFAEKEVRIRLPLQELKVLLMDEANDNLEEADNESLNE